MRFGVGTDIIRISRFMEDNVEKGFLDRVFSEEELEYCNSKANPEQHLAARFAAKEAVVKAMGCLGEGIPTQQVKVGIKDNGCPIAILPKGYEMDAHVSLSHEGDYAIAMAVVIEHG